jgi:hypothetical protein
MLDAGTMKLKLCGIQNNLHGYAPLNSVPTSRLFLAGTAEGGIEKSP